MLKLATCLTLALATLILSGCAGNDPVAVYRDYRALFQKGDMERTLRFLPQQDSDLVKQLTATYKTYCAWVDANRQSMQGMLEGQELIRAAQDFSKLTDDVEVFRYHMRIAGITGGGEPAEMPASVQIEGETATLTFPEGQTRTMVKENGKWRVHLLPAVEKDLQNSKKQLEMVINKIPVK